MKRNIPEPLLKALRKALNEHADKMLRSVTDQSQHNVRAFQASGRKVNKLWDTALNVPYMDAR